jgi:hypothetical protein
LNAYYDFARELRECPRIGRDLPIRGHWRYSRAKLFRVVAPNLAHPESPTSTLMGKLTLLLFAEIKWQAEDGF